jgi:hypothetical protein
MAYDPNKRTGNPWYKLWKTILKVCGWLYAIVEAGLLLSYLLLPDAGWLFFWPMLLAIFSVPLFMVAGIALYIMREDDRERARIYARLMQQKDETQQRG